MTTTKHTSGPSVARATCSTRDPFSRATLILTAYFTAGIFVVLLVMNVLMYWLFIKNLHIEPHDDRVSIIAGDMYFPEDNEDNVEDEDDEGMEEELSEEVRENLISTLFVIDIFVVIAGAGIGYLLARGALRPIRLSYERQKRFVSDAAHELRTPLSVLKAATESSLERERTTPEYIRILKDIFDETHMLTSITDDLLLFSRIERIPSIHTEDVLLSEVVETEARRIEPYADKRKIVLQKTLEPDIHVKGDVYLLKRAFMSVLKNAVDYNKDGGEVAIVLARSTSNHTSRLQIQVLVLHQATYSVFLIHSLRQVLLERLSMGMVQDSVYRLFDRVLRHMAGLLRLQAKLERVQR